MGIPHEPPDSHPGDDCTDYMEERLRAGGFGSVKRGWILAQFASRLHRLPHMRLQAGTLWREETSTRKIATSR
jgi:hypothetical protein